MSGVHCRTDFLTTERSYNHAGTGNSDPQMALCSTEMLRHNRSIFAANILVLLYFDSSSTIAITEILKY